jgi:VWFA-related protein
MRDIICSLGILLLAASSPGAQDKQELPTPSQTLKVNIEVVNVYAVVRQKNGRLLPDLTKDDFTLEEDRKPQEIRYFSRETDTPLTMGILVDTSPSQGRVLDVEKREAEAFLRDVLRPKDLAFVLHFDVEVELLQDFTADLHRLDNAIEEGEINGGGTRPTPGTFPSGDSAGATHLYDAIYLSARELLKNEVGRKVLIMLTDGEDQGSKVKLETALEAAQKADIIIYSVNIHDRGFYSRQGMGYGGESVLRRFSDETGGRVIDANSKDSSAAFQQIANELRTQYLLGYTPTNNKLDGTFRKIEVKVRSGDVKVNARRGYYAPEG